MSELRFYVFRGFHWSINHNDERTWTSSNKGINKKAILHVLIKWEDAYDAMLSEKQKMQKASKFLPL